MKYVKRPVPAIEAEQYTTTYMPRGVIPRMDGTAFVMVDGRMEREVVVGDWIVTETNGNVYPIKDKAFQANYEVAPKECQ